MVAMVRSGDLLHTLRRIRRKLVIYFRYRHFGNLRRVRERYLQLMLGCLTGSIYEDPPLKALGSDTFDAKLREYGWDWPSVAHSMIGRRRMGNLRDLAEEVLFNRVPGDFIETGVWRGGAVILMKGILKACGSVDRRVFAADSFQGLPPPDQGKYPADAGDDHHRFRDYLGVSRQQVEESFRRYGLLDDKVVFLEGWFKDTLASAPIERLAILRLDGDMFESTHDALQALYPKLQPGGFCIVDDYSHPACRQAVDDYFRAHDTRPSPTRIDWSGAFWRKPFA